MQTIEEILYILNFIPSLIKTLISFIPQPFGGIIIFWFAIIIGVVIYKFVRGDS